MYGNSDYVFKYLKIRVVHGFLYFIQDSRGAIFMNYVNNITITIIIHS